MSKGPSWLPGEIHVREHDILPRSGFCARHDRLYSVTEECPLCVTGRPLPNEKGGYGLLPTDSEVRKGIPIATGCIDYFPDAIAEVAELSRLGNDKHNPGQPLHWSRGKSADHPDCLMRHFLERGKFDTSWEPNKVRHSIEMAWRALAIAQLEIEASRGGKHE